MRLLISGLGFQANSVVRPAELVDAEAILLLWTRDERSASAKAEVSDRLRHIPVKALYCESWDPIGFYSELVTGVEHFFQPRGGNTPEVFVNLTAGHGIMHACLGHMAFERGWRMVHWRPEDDDVVVFSAYDLGARRVPPQTRRVAEAINTDWLTAKEIMFSTRLSVSTVYDAIKRLKADGLVESRTSPAGEMHRLLPSVRPDGGT